jgi:hypothetical protein
MKSTTDAPPSAVHQPRDIPAWVDRDVYPFTSRFLDLPTVRLHHVDEGAGHPVLFVHGTPTCRKSHRGVSSPDLNGPDVNVGWTRHLDSVAVGAAAIELCDAAVGGQAGRSLVCKRHVPSVVCDHHGDRRRTDFAVR